MAKQILKKTGVKAQCKCLIENKKVKLYDTNSNTQHDQRLYSNVFRFCFRIYLWKHSRVVAPTETLGSSVIKQFLYLMNHFNI